MRPNETELQMVMRHVRDGAAIERLTSLGLPTDEAEELLILLERIQSEHILHLKRLEQPDAGTTCEGKSNVQ